MKYSRGFRETILRKVLPPENQPIRRISKENGISEQTIRNWMILAKDGKLDETDCDMSPSHRSPEEKLRLVIEGKTITEEKLGGWLREHGMHSEHLSLWEQELKSIVTDKNDKIKEELASLRKKNKDLEKELLRKDKTIAEMAALITLKKKWEAFLEEREVDSSEKK
jgi:transposase